MKEILNKLDQELASATLNDNSDINKDFLIEVIVKLSEDYSHYRNYIADVLHILNTYEETSFSLLLSVYRKKLLSILNKNVYKERHLGEDFIFEDSLTTEYLKKTIPQLKNSRQSLHDINIDLSDVTEDEVKSYLSYIEQLISVKKDEGDFNTRDIEDVFSSLILAKDPVISLGLEEWFMLNYNLFIELLQKYRFHQQARDHCETLLQFSFDVKKPECGFYSSHNLYIKQSNQIFSLVYGLLCLETISQKDSTSETLLKWTYYRGLILYRNIDNDQYLEELLMLRPKELNFTEYEKQSHHYTYFSCALNNMDSSSTRKCKAYLDKKREDILTLGAGATEPWISLLLNFKALFPVEFDSSDLKQYINTFKTTISDDRFEYIESITVGNEGIEESFKNELEKITATRHQSDYAFDNDTLIVLANHMIDKGFKEKDERAYLKAMLVKADNSIVFKNSIVDDIIELDTSGKMDFSSEIEMIDSDLYGFEKIDFENDLLFLCATNHNFYSLCLKNNSDISQLQNWGTRNDNSIDNKLNTLIDKNPFSNSLESYFIEDFEQYSNKFYAYLKTYNITNLDYRDTFVVKGMNIANYPHNLILDKNKRFIFPVNGVCDIVSREWFIKKNTSKASSIGVYLPTKQGDFLYNKIFSSIESTLDEYQVNKYLNAHDLDDMEEDIKIVISHGRNDISRFPAIYTSENLVKDVYASISSGKLLIMLICHSGSSDRNSFSNKVNSLAKLFLEEKYETVIAPFWALHSGSISIWIESFLMKLREGENVFVAHKDACGALGNRFPSPYIYSCLHMYGNPYLSMD